MRLAAAAFLLFVLAVAALAVNYIGAAGGHCDEVSCGGDFPRWLYLGSGWVVTLCLAALLILGVAAIVRRVRR